ncbi:DUF420 domain-containing protein [Halobacterium sp. BOL4-2]|uniref:DUF420 domain-containing protein n=1 Tax=Halobacterium sp. BOL4-2 TaxID=2810537 RepID=UPI00196370F9|nr:DUF420 domain-containing protein [Halobacterium sp. BOL4-2]QRY23938.1 DUF420 domain-containing protein [Halobacterium sp. BOL4-2]
MGMADGFVRRHVAGLAAVLGVASIAVVVAAVRGVIPAGVLPQAPAWFIGAIPPLNAVISAAAIATILAGWRWIRRGDVAKHRAAMATTTLLFVAFLGLYLYRLVVHGTTAFPTTGAVYTFVYLPVLIIHMGLAIACIPLVYYVLLLAGTRPISEIYDSNHARVGRVAASLWLVSFALGIVVYLMLYVLY